MRWGKMQTKWTHTCTLKPILLFVMRMEEQQAVTTTTATTTQS